MRHRTLTLTLALALATAALAHAHAANRSETIVVRYDARAMALDAHLLTQLLTPALLNEASRPFEGLGLTAAEISRHGNLKLQQPDGVFVGRLDLLYAAKLEPEQRRRVFRAVCALLARSLDDQLALATGRAGQRERRSALILRLEETERKRAQVLSELHDRQARHPKSLAQHVESVTRTQVMLAQLDTERQTLRVEADKMRERLAQDAAKAKAEAARAAQLVDKLRATVDISRSQLQAIKLRHKQGVATSQEMRAAELELLQLERDLLTLQSQAETAATAATSARTRARLDQVELRVVRAEKQLADLEDQLTAKRQAYQERKAAQPALQRLQLQLGELTRRSAELRKALASTPRDAMRAPTVHIWGDRPQDDAGPGAREAK